MSCFFRRTVYVVHLRKSLITHLLSAYAYLYTLYNCSVLFLPVLLTRMRSKFVH